MNLKYDIIHLNDSIIYILEYNEYDYTNYLDQLTQIEVERLYSFKSESRKKEFVATRILRHSIFGHTHIHYNNIGAPYIDQEGYISISHSKNIVGIAFNQHYQIGFDIEIIRPSIIKLKDKFINNDENITFNCSDIKTLTEIWSAKETLYKLSNLKELDFKKNLILNKKESQMFGSIKIDEKFLSTEISIFEYNGKIITINSTPCE